MNYFEAVNLLDMVKHGHPASIHDISLALFLTGDIDEEPRILVGCSRTRFVGKTEAGNSPKSGEGSHQDEVARS